MTATLSLLTVLGGVGLFLFGMDQLVTGLQRLAGMRARALIRNLSNTRLGGLAGGTAVASLIHSGPTSVIVLSFVNAGFLTFVASLPIIYGANLGTTLAMQLIAFNIGRYCFAFIGLGLILRIFFRSEKGRLVSLIPIGIGMVFLGLLAMREAMEVLRDSEALLAVLAMIDGETWLGLVTGVLVGLVITAIFQSSGGTLSILFSLAAMGLFTDLHDVLPVLLGMNVGKCSPTVIATIGGGAAARRVALAHVLFNVVLCVQGVIFLNYYAAWIPELSSNLVRQVAHLNTFLVLGTVVIMMPLTVPFARLVERLIRAGDDAAESQSHLDGTLIRTPEKAILATIRELQRQSEIIDRMFKQSLDGVASLNLRKFDHIAIQENSVDIIKHEVESYLNAISERRLSTRQALMLQRLFRVAVALERIADHIEMIGELLRYKVRLNIWFDDETMRRLLELCHLVREMMTRTMQSLDPTCPEHRGIAIEALKTRKRYKTLARELREGSNLRLTCEGQDAKTALFLIRFLAAFDRIVHHLREIAREEKSKSYMIKSWKLDRVEPRADRHGMPAGYQLSDTYEEALRKLEERTGQLHPEEDESFAATTSSGEHRRPEE